MSMKAIFQATDARQKKSFKGGAILLTYKHWNAITTWNAKTVIGEDTDYDAKVIAHLDHSDYVVRTQNIKIWTKRIIDSLIKPENYQYFDGFSSQQMCFPHIKENACKQGISMLHLTQIIIKNREEIQCWYDKHRNMFTNINSKKGNLKVAGIEEVKVEKIEVKTNEMLEIKSQEFMLKEVDDWEELAEDEVKEAATKLYFAPVQPTQIQNMSDVDKIDWVLISKQSTHVYLSELEQCKAAWDASKSATITLG